MDNHTCEALVVTCIDFRLQEAINSWISKNFQPKAYDRVALARGVKDLETILGQIDIAVRLHHIKKVVLINHEDCGAYEVDETPQKHAQDLRGAAKKIKEQYPDLKVDTYYLYLNGNVEPVK